MRFVPTTHLKEGQKLASDLTLSENRIMIRRSKALTKALIRRIEVLGYHGVYIDDAISAGIDVPHLIHPEARAKATHDIRKLHDSIEKNALASLPAQLKNIESQTVNIVDEIMHNPHVMINMVDIKAYDDYTYNHSFNVAVLSIVIAKVLGLNRNLIYELAMGAILHDIGKIFVDKEILNKPGKLTPEEFHNIQQHSQHGYDFIVNSKDISDAAKLAVLHHHEAYNGTGYPDGLSGDSIPLFGRIISVADVYDALTSVRPYHTAFLPSDAIEFIMSEYNTKFDPKIVDAMVKRIAPYPVGTCVRLSNGVHAIVIKNRERAILRPLVRVIDAVPETYIDLENDREALKITIEAVIDNI